MLKKNMNNRGGMELTLNTLMIMVIALIVGIILVSILYFYFYEGKLAPAIGGIGDIGNDWLWGVGSG